MARVCGTSDIKYIGVLGVFSMVVKNKMKE